MMFISPAETVRLNYVQHIWLFGLLNLIIFAALFLIALNKNLESLTARIIVLMFENLI